MPELSGLVNEYLAFREARGLQPNRKLERLLIQFTNALPPDRPDGRLFTHGEALAWAHERLAARFGPIALSGPVWEFKQTTYYEATMGPGLQKQLLVFRDLVAPDQLASIKLATNALEKELARMSRACEGGEVGSCRVIEVLSDHDLCEVREHPPA